MQLINLEEKKIIKKIMKNHTKMKKKEYTGYLSKLP